MYLPSATCWDFALRREFETWPTDASMFPTKEVRIPRSEISSAGRSASGKWPPNGKRSYDWPPRLSAALRRTRFAIEGFYSSRLWKQHKRRSGNERWYQGSEKEVQR